MNTATDTAISCGKVKIAFLILMFFCFLSAQFLLAIRPDQHIGDEKEKTKQKKTVSTHAPSVIFSISTPMSSEQLISFLWSDIKVVDISLKKNEKPTSA